MASEPQILYSDKFTAEAMVKWLSSFGQDRSGGVSRLLYSSSWVEAQHALKGKMEHAGLTTYFDSVGNLFGRLEGKENNSKTILTGSHIDSVVNGGVYDGVYGIIASLLAVQRLYQAYGKPKKTLEVVSLCEEEGSRFPLTFWGSGSITGKYSLEDIQNLTDSEGTSFTNAMKEAGFDPMNYQSPQRTDIACFVELHVEQGILLDRQAKSLGMVSHIVGQRRFTIQITGESNHAGTTPMPYRKDAMTTASHFISYLTAKAQETDPGLVATVGKITAKPNVPNVIAGEVSFTLDVRHYNEEVIDEFCRHLFTYFESFTKNEEIQLAIHQWMSVKPVKMDPELTDLFVKIALNKNISHLSLVSGAGHDAQMFGTFCPTALLFVPSVGGISHSPKEYTKSGDLEKGIDVLTEFLYKLAYE